MNENKITKSGLNAFLKELKYLIEVEQPAILDALKAAREQGDLSENADYDAARKRQAEIEGEIKRLENIVATCEVSDTSDSPADIVDFDRLVTVQDLSDNSIEEYHLVNTVEVKNVNENKISLESPLAKAIINHKIGDIVTVKAKIEYSVKILAVKTAA